MMLKATAATIDEALLQEQFVRASGPGGQNVNKVATAVQLRYDVNRAEMPPDMRRRLASLAGTLLTADGEILIQASRYRSQVQNRADARKRLLSLLQRAAIRPRRRIATAPTRASRERRLQNKQRRSALKRERQSTE